MTAPRKINGTVTFEAKGQGTTNFKVKPLLETLKLTLHSPSIRLIVEHDDNEKNSKFSV